MLQNTFVDMPSNLAFASILGNGKMLIQVLCVICGKGAQVKAGMYDIKDLIKVMAKGAILPRMARECVATILKGAIPGEYIENQRNW